MLLWSVLPPAWPHQRKGHVQWSSIAKFNSYIFVYIKVQSYPTLGRVPDVGSRLQNTDLGMFPLRHFLSGCHYTGMPRPRYGDTTDLENWYHCMGQIKKLQTKALIFSQVHTPGPSLQLLDHVVHKFQGPQSPPQLCQIINMPLFQQSHQDWPTCSCQPGESPGLAKLTPTPQWLLWCWLRRPPNSHDPSCFSVISIPHMNRQQPPPWRSYQDLSGVCSKQVSSLKTGPAFKHFPLPASAHLSASTCQMDGQNVIVQTVNNLNTVAYFLQTMDKKVLSKHLCSPGVCFW